MANERLNAGGAKNYAAGDAECWEKK